MLHFRSQAAADRYVVEQHIKELNSKGRLNAARKARLVILHRRLNALQSPVYRLPDDQLALIFELGAQSGKDVSFAILVSHVVSRWRTVALRSSGLWSSIAIPLPIGKTRSADRWKVMLQRSCDSRLDVRLMIRRGMSLGLVQSAADVITPLYSRCQHLAISSEQKKFDGPTPIRYPIPVNSVRRLVHLELSFIDFSSPSQSLLSLLSECPAIESLRLRYIAVGHLPPAGNPIELPALRVLDVLQMEASDGLCYGLVPHLRTKRLERINLDFAERFPQELSSSLDLFFSIRSFCVACRDFPSSLFQLIAGMLFLKELKLVAMSFEYEKFDAQTPKLLLPTSAGKVIIIACSGVTSFVHFLFGDCSLGKRRGGPIGTLRIVHCTGVSPDLSEWMEDHVPYVSIEDGPQHL